MSSIIQHNYDDAIDYSFDSAKIEIVSGKATLKIASIGNNFIQAFTSDSGFTYDNTKAEFAAGVIRQTDQTPTDSVVGATYTTVTDASWSTGSTTGTLNGSPVITANKIVCTNGTKGVYYAVNNDGTGAIKVKYTPDYTGAPGGNVNIFSVNEASGQNNRIVLTHSPSGSTFRLTMNDSVGAAVLGPAIAIGPNPNLTSGTEVELELNWDNSGTVRLFLDGALHGSASPTAWTHGTGAARLSVGATANIYDTADGSFADLVLFSSVQHTAAYTAGYSLTETKYLSSEATLPDFTHVGPGAIISLDGLTTTDVATPKYNLRVDSDAYQYWNGSAWTSSDGTYTQSSTEADIDTNLGSFPGMGSNATVTFRLAFDDTNTQMSVDNLDLDHTGNIYSTDDPTIVTNSNFCSTDLTVFAATETIPALTALQHIMQLNGQDRYWNGAAWANSNSTFAQSNTTTDINTNILALLVTRQCNIKVKSILRSTDGTARPDLDLVQITFNAALDDPTLPATTRLQGFLYDHATALNNEIVQVRPFDGGWPNGDIFHKYEFKTIGTTTAEGWFDGVIFVQPTQRFWEVKVGKKRYTIELTSDAVNNIAEAYVRTLEDE